MRPGRVRALNACAHLPNDRAAHARGLNRKR